MSSLAVGTMRPARGLLSRSKVTEAENLSLSDAEVKNA